MEKKYEQLDEVQQKTELLGLKRQHCVKDHISKKTHEKTDYRLLCKYSESN